MRTRFVEHGAGIALVGLILVLFSTAVIHREEGTRQHERALFAPLLAIPGLDPGNPLHVAMLRETMRLRHAEAPERADSLVDALLDYRQRQFTDPLLKAGGGRRPLSGALVLKLGRMYAEFLAVFAVAMLLSYFGARSLAVHRFVARKRGRPGTLERLRRAVDTLRVGPSAGTVVRSILHIAAALGRAAARISAGCLLFAPGFVIAYAIRTRIDTSSSLALVALAVLTNGLLVNSANRLYTLLMAESRKGYVLTAIVKNLGASYRPGAGGIGWKAILQPGRLAASHVFHHIYLNARYQYVPAIKEHAAFLVTGLIILEMALNIQNHLGYELLQAILFRDVAVVAVIVFGIYLLVKATEVLADLWFHRVSRRYENAE